MNFNKDRPTNKKDQLFWQGFLSRTHEVKKSSTIPESRALHEDITVNLVNCRYSVVEDAVLSLGWKVVKNNFEPWDIFWSDAVEIMLRRPHKLSL